jgi:ubiquinone/menaquinone biosynthesis C-methylase UbiE
VTAAPFDRIAAGYDAAWTGTAIGRAQRAQVWEYLDPLFAAGDSVLDIGCGTGEDAAHLAELEVKVHATDPSGEMIRFAAARGEFTTEVATAEEITATTAAFDGALSNFGALNCVQDLNAVAAGLAVQIRPGGFVLLCVIGRFCLWETLYFTARMQFRKALRRVLHRSVMSSLGVRVYYRSVRQLLQAFAPHFECRLWHGVGLLVPPSYISLPDAMVQRLGRADRLIAGLPLLRACADHRLVILVRK